jgi:hypothetical protein
MCDYYRFKISSSFSFLKILTFLHRIVYIQIFLGFFFCLFVFSCLMDQTHGLEHAGQMVHIELYLSQMKSSVFVCVLCLCVSLQCTLTPLLEIVLMSSCMLGKKVSTQSYLARQFFKVSYLRIHVPQNKKSCMS